MITAKVTSVEQLPSGEWRYKMESDSDGGLGGIDSSNKLAMKVGDKLEFEGTFQEPETISFAGTVIWKSHRRRDEEAATQAN